MDPITLDLSDTETYGEAGEDGRPANIPEKFWKAADGDNPAGLDFGSFFGEYTHRTKQIGAADGLIGKPEDAYAKPELELAEGVEYELADDDPLVASFLEYAGERNLSQKAVNDIISWYVNTQSGMSAEAEAAAPEVVKAEFEKIAPNGEGEKAVEQMTQRMENLTKDMPEDEAKEILAGYKSALHSAETYKFLSFMESLAQPGKLPDNPGAGADGKLSKADVDAMQNEIVEEGPHKGKRRIDVDPKWRNEVRKARRALVGDGPQKKQVVELNT